MFPYNLYNHELNNNVATACKTKSSIQFTHLLLSNISSPKIPKILKKRLVDNTFLFIIEKHNGFIRQFFSFQLLYQT